MNLTLNLLPTTFAICRLAPNQEIPTWANGEFVSITHTVDELSIVCEQEHIPDDAQAERGWRCFRVAGKLDFSLVGVIASLTTVLAEAGISVLVVATFETDYLLVREQNVEGAVGALVGAGHLVER